ncbi:hypothetical protein LMG33810_001603 [Carnimonas sp. LMG 33810]|uniref:HlyU family transcriptional regulator n=1 Tax=Carnimonas bestiolae TaxID=3402172 RepID=UPI003EDC7289
MIKRWFSRWSKSDNGASTHAAPAFEHKGHEIIAAPEKVAGQYRVSGVIRRTLPDGRYQQVAFERSDTLPALQGCIELTQDKAVRYIDDMGEQIFADVPVEHG